MVVKETNKLSFDGQTDGPQKSLVSVFSKIYRKHRTRATRRRPIDRYGERQGKVLIPDLKEQRNFCQSSVDFASGKV